MVETTQSKILVFALEGTDDFGQCVGLLGLLRETVSAWDRDPPDDKTIAVDVFKPAFRCRSITRLHEDGENGAGDAIPRRLIVVCASGLGLGTPQNAWGWNSWLVYILPNTFQKVHLGCAHR